MGNYDGKPVSGIGTEYTTQDRIITKGGEQYLPGGGVIDGSLSRDPLNTSYVDRLRAGVLMGIITASKKWAPSILGVTASAYTSGGSDGTSITVSAATATELVRRVGTSGTCYVTGPPTAGGTVVATACTFSAVNTTTGVITITDMSVDKIAGSFIQPDDGSETARSFVGNGNPIKVTDRNGTSQDTRFSEITIGGVVDSSQIVNWPSNAVLRTYLLNQLAANGAGLFTFDNLYE